MEGILILQENKDINNYMKKRIIGIMIDYFLFVSILGISFTLLMQYNESYEYRFFMVFIYPILFFIIYCGVFIKLTNGSTLGGVIIGLKITGLNRQMSILNYLIRFLYAFFLPVQLFSLTSFKVNSIGQLYYDEKFKTVVIDRKGITTIQKINNIKYYEYIYAFKALKLFLKTFLFFVLLTLLSSLIKFLVLQFIGS